MNLALDLSSKCGYSVFTNSNELKAWGVINVPRTDDLKNSVNTFNRSTRFAGDLTSLIKEFGIEHIIVELPHGSQNFHSANVFGFTSGVVASVVAVTGVGYTIISEGDNKKHNLGRFRGVKKNDMINRIAEFYPAILELPFRKSNHIADSIGAYFVAKDLNRNFVLGDRLRMIGSLVVHP
jgi:Holliday junction resolvasome RuvABC endonuclease subunit